MAGITWSSGEQGGSGYRIPEPDYEFNEGHLYETGPSPQTLQTSLLFAECRYHYSNHLIKRLIILGDLSSRTLD